MSTAETEEIILAVLCVAPFVLVAAAALYLSIAADTCDEVGE